MPWDWKLTKEPKPFSKTINGCEAFSWPIIDNEPLSKNFETPSKDYFDVIEDRKTRRVFNLISDTEISGVLWYTLRTKANLASDVSRILKPIPSAGATHSVNLIVISPDRVTWRYNANNHSKDILNIPETQISLIKNNCKELVDPGKGYLLILVAEINRIANYYDDFESLIWRDSGVILGALSNTAEAFNLAYCPLGISGDEWIKIILSSNKQAIRGVGVAILGGG